RDLVGNQIYWGCWTTWPSHANAPIPYRSGIYRSNLDGSHVEHIPSGTLDGSRVENISSEPWGRGYLPAITSIALYIPHPTSVSTPNTTPAIPTTSGLDPNFPNPFNASTQIAYRLASPGPVRLEIYNVLGQPVRTLANQFQPAGFYKIPWDARDQRGAPLAAGVYLTHLRHPDGAQTRRLLYLK
ncbi:MAG: T9SS type A sorting domain-containing protein, partial [Gemmatimonadetes bacterium]|nr:T9SS type A sorting domain-containing protein [Gemmatimonadota bacterium]